jgi:AbrB family looped-hinge helix DNA binding protein
MITAKIGRRGQVTVPREVRRKVNLKEGDRIAFVVEGDDLIVRPLRQTLLDLRGSVPVEGEQDFTQIRRDVLASRAKRRAES